MRLIALIAAAIVAAAAGDIDPCKRQPFRGRCPSKNGAPPSRSQFVLRYYLRDGECVSYPYGHCLNDDSEPKLFRYKEECEDACVKGPGNLGTPKETVKVVKTVDTSSSTDDANVDFEMTYGTVPPITENTPAPTTAPHVEPTVTPQTEKPTPATEKPTPKTDAPTTEELTEESSASTTEKATTAEAATTSAPRTECERRRAQSGGLIRGGFVPACTTEGQFEKMQCEPSGGQCFCVDDKGIELPNSRTRGRPDCTRILSASAPKTNECVGVPTSGPCSSSMERWYYDESMQLCKAFKYSGCGGNGNNYASEQACKARCAPPPLGAPKCEKGEPLKTVTGAPINCAKRDCPTGYKCSVIQGSSVCCPQNEKSAGALQSGHPSDPCQMQKERGPCDRYELRFYYNAEMKECKYFFYGGCDGNGNNFEKVEDCEVRCNVTKPTRFGGHVTQSLNPTQPAGVQTVTKESTTERPTTQRPTTHSTPPSTTVRPTTGPVLSLRPAVAQGPDQTVMESNRCRHPKDAGTCRGQFVRWFFNFELGRCEAFTYTGCAGNGNNFASEEECLTGCAKEGTKNGQVTTAILETDDGEKEVPAVANVCIHDVDAGDCNGVFQRFAFDQESGECRPFTYGGCGGNGNNFAALVDCERKCGGAKAPVVVAPTTAPFVPPPVNICEHPVDKGPCNGIFARYAFDPLTSDCQQFTYGGCGGNGNNFASASDCRQVCMKPSTQASHTTATPVVHCPPAPRCQPGCQMARDQHSCIVCNCDRAAHPPAPLPSAPQARPACPPIDMQACVEPCIVFSNRKGCQECVCPVPDPNFHQTVQPHGASIFSSAATVAAAQPPSHRESVAPPSFNTAHPPGFVHPPAPRQQSVKNVESFQKHELQEIEKPLAPLPTNRVEPLRTLPTQDSRSPGQAPPQHLAPHFSREQSSPQIPQTHSGPIAPAPVPAQLTEKCMQPVDAGPCSNYVDRWFFNADDGQCHPFKYGGCAGNRNHFFTMRECEIHCARFSRNIDSETGHNRPPPNQEAIEQHFAHFVQRVSEMVPELNRKLNASIPLPTMTNDQTKVVFVKDINQAIFSNMVTAIPKFNPNETEVVAMKLPEDVNNIPSEPVALPPQLRPISLPRPLQDLSNAVKHPVVLVQQSEKGVPVINSPPRIESVPTYQSPPVGGGNRKLSPPVVPEYYGFSSFNRPPLMGLVNGKLNFKEVKVAGVNQMIPTDADIRQEVGDLVANKNVQQEPKDVSRNWLAGQHEGEIHLQEHIISSESGQKHLGQVELSRNEQNNLQAAPSPRQIKNSEAENTRLMHHQQIVELQQRNQYEKELEQLQWLQKKELEEEARLWKLKNNGTQPPPSNVQNAKVDETIRNIEQILRQSTLQKDDRVDVPEVRPRVPQESNLDNRQRSRVSLGANLNELKPPREQLRVNVEQQQRSGVRVPLGDNSDQQQFFQQVAKERESAELVQLQQQLWKEQQNSHRSQQAFENEKQHQLELLNLEQQLRFQQQLDAQSRQNSVSNKNVLRPVPFQPVEAHPPVNNPMDSQRNVLHQLEQRQLAKYETMVRRTQEKINPNVENTSPDAVKPTGIPIPLPSPKNVKPTADLRFAEQKPRQQLQQQQQQQQQLPNGRLLSTLTANSSEARNVASLLLQNSAPARVNHAGVQLTQQMLLDRQRKHFDDTSDVMVDASLSSLVDLGSEPQDVKADSFGLSVAPSIVTTDGSRNRVTVLPLRPVEEKTDVNFDDELRIEKELQQATVNERQVRIDEDERIRQKTLEQQIYLDEQSEIQAALKITEDKVVTEDDAEKNLQVEKIPANGTSSSATDSLRKINIGLKDHKKLNKTENDRDVSRITSGNETSLATIRRTQPKVPVAKPIPEDSTSPDSLKSSDEAKIVFPALLGNPLVVPPRVKSHQTNTEKTSGENSEENESSSEEQIQSLNNRQNTSVGDAHGENLSSMVSLTKEMADKLRMINSKVFREPAHSQVAQFADHVLHNFLHKLEAKVSQNERKVATRQNISEEEQTSQNMDVFLIQEFERLADQFKKIQAHMMNEHNPSENGTSKAHGVRTQDAQAKPSEADTKPEAKDKIVKLVSKIASESKWKVSQQANASEEVENAGSTNATEAGETPIDDVIKGFMEQAQEFQDKAEEIAGNITAIDVQLKENLELERTLKEQFAKQEPMEDPHMLLITPDTKPHQLLELSENISDSSAPLFLQNPPEIAPDPAIVNRAIIADNFPTQMLELNETLLLSDITNNISDITDADVSTSQPINSIDPSVVTRLITPSTAQEHPSAAPAHVTLIHNIPQTTGEPLPIQNHLNIQSLSAVDAVPIMTADVSTNDTNTLSSLAGFVTSVPKAAGVAQFGVTPDVDNAQYVPPQLVDRRAFGEHNREMEPIALSTLDKLGDTTSSLEMNEPHPPTSSFEENSIEEDDVPRAPGTSSSVPPSTTPSVPSVSVSVPRDTAPPAAIPPVTFAAVERVVETTSPSTEAPTTTTATSTTSTITTMEKTTAPAATTTQANTVTAKVAEETSEEEDVEYEVSETDTPVFASLPPKLKEQPASVSVPKTSTVLPTAAPTTTDTVAPAMKEVKIVPKIHLEEVTAPLTEKTVSAEKTSKEEVEDDWEEETDSPFTDDDSSLAEAHRVEGVKNVQTASKIPEKPDTSTDDISAEVADPDMRPMPSSTEAPSTTSTAPPTTEKSTTANTAPTRQQLPVRPDGAGREPVPLAPVGIGRSMQELNIDQMDGELEQPTEKIFHPTVAPSRAPETPRAEQHNNEHFNTHSLRQDSFSPQVSCTLPPDAGLCKNYVPRWFFNAQTGLCEQFSFGSCGGNANNFMDRANCEFKCRSLHRPTSVLSQVPERCSFEKDTGFGRGYNVKWYFNMKNLRCEQFVYEGKGGNANQFDTLTDCERYCTPQPGSVVVRPAVQLPPLETPIPQPPAPRQQPPPQPVPVPQPATINTESRLPQAQAPVISAPGRSSSSAMDSDEALQPEEMEESKEAGGVNTNNNLQEIPDSVHSFENPQAELDKLDAEYDDGPAAPVVASRPPVGSEEVSAIPAFEPRPPAAAHSAKKENVQAPQPIPNVAANIDDQPKESYKAEPIPAKPAATGNEGLPRVRLTPPETVNYQTGAKPKTHGILNFGEGNAIDTDKFEFPEDSDEPKPPMPTCPNGLQEHRYVDGRAVQCLPGRNQCPDNSECYFNGLDYYCCPNVEDPYDKHIFGGYDGEEEKHGYKAFGPLKIRRLRDQPISRRKRQSAFNMDDIVLPLRFDDSKPKQFARAGAIMPTRNVRRKQASINKQKEALDVASANVAVCVQELAKGDCSEAHLRYFYDRNSDSCRLFYYSGCKGNENNFGSLEDCQKTCVLGMKQMQVVANANIPTQSATEPPVLPGQCPGGKSPLGGAAPVLCGNNTDSIGCPIGYHCRNGPPDVCCPGQDPAKLSLDLLLAQKSNVRFAPRIDADQFSVTTTEAPHRSFLDVPKFICPDASDPLMGTNGLPLMCGAGFDGMKMCPRGFYCAIDSEKGSRLCCPLLGAGSRLPSQEAQTPYFGRRKANPGEVIDRGTLPADQVEYTRRKEKLAIEAKPQLPETGPSPSEFEDTEASESAQTSVEAQTTGAQESTEVSAQSGESSTETASTEEGFAQLKMKPDNNHEKEQKEAAAHNPHVAVVDAESDGVSINTGAEAKSELEDDNVQSKEVVDQSICHLTPSEGRQCRDDEQSPRTNLHYFYSAKDKRCKLYFYRGCGGNANRFEKKAACEERCLTRA